VWIEITCGAWQRGRQTRAGGAEIDAGGRAVDESEGGDDEAGQIEKRVDRECVWIGPRGGLSERGRG
jgi:hypothetical protein